MLRAMRRPAPRCWPLAVFLLVAAAAPVARAQQSAPARTVVRDQAAKRQLLGEHKLSLQWISWKHFGKATVTDRDGLLELRGEQRRDAADTQGSPDDFLRLEGVVTEVRALEFVLRGAVTTRVSHLADGKECRREGIFTFAIKGKRRYWRLQQMQNPCDEVVDYVDLYLR
jgi:hypothetical protein